LFKIKELDLYSLLKIMKRRNRDFQPNDIVISILFIVLILVMLFMVRLQQLLLDWLNI